MANGHPERTTALPFPGVSVTGLMLALLRAALVAKAATQLQLKGDLFEGCPHNSQVGELGSRLDLHVGQRSSLNVRGS